MANTLTGLIPTIRESLDVVSREQVGLIPAVWKNPTGKNLERAALNQTIQFPIVPSTSLSDTTPGQLPADEGSQTIGYDTLTISKSKHASILWNGEEQKSLSNGDRPTINGLLSDQFQQAFRELTNAVELDLWTAGIAGASNAAGSGGTLPFGTAGDLSDFANAMKVLNQNGAPKGDLHMVLGNSSAANLRAKQSVLFKVNESGTDSLLRDGTIGRVQGFGVGESNQIGGHTAGDAASATTDATGYAVGSTTITLASAGTGAILAGDVITFSGDDNKYVVVTGDADVSGGGSITIASPGLKEAIPAAATAITVQGTTNESNLFFSRNAIVLVSRMPALPEGGDSADDRMTVVDPVSGLAFEVSMYKQYRQVKYEVALAWGYKVVKTPHLGLLLG